MTQSATRACPASRLANVIGRAPLILCISASAGTKLRLDRGNGSRLY